ncbi:unnamed protein product [Meganyctiphanes norvegica]|uniref:Hexosyltransferase n=1 Tax=Meganyctiphanes norvegica TaxID=48144 RepID=A0AAV2RVG7_MEGNR
MVARRRCSTWTTVLCVTPAILVTLYVTTIGQWHYPGDADVSVAPYASTEEPESWNFLEENFQYPKETIEESIPFRYFEGIKTYQSDGDAVRSMTQHEKSLLMKARDDGAKHLADMHPDSKPAFLSGRYRWLPDGIEYDFHYYSRTTMETKRVSAFQKLGPLRIVKYFAVNQKEVVNIIVPLKGRVSKYVTFLNHLISDVLPYDEDMTLTVVYFEDDFMQSAEEVTRETLASFPNFKWSFVPVNRKEFSRGYGLNVGVQHAEKENMGQLLFFCDVDVRMHPDFFQRCRSNTQLGQQVYYPVVFSLYNPSLVYPLLDRDIPPTPEQLLVDQDTGFWRNFGFGMSCMYIPDYKASGGFPDISTWGGEDTKLYENFLNIKSIKVIRSPDPGLFHLYHKKECNDITSLTYPSCLKSKAMTEGSQLQLGLTLVKLTDGTDLEGILSKRFYYFWLIKYLAIVLVVSVLANLIQAVGLLRNTGYNARLNARIRRH